jgi:hypothetical protein
MSCEAARIRQSSGSQQFTNWQRQFEYPPSCFGQVARHRDHRLMRLVFASRRLRRSRAVECATRSRFAHSDRLHHTQQEVYREPHGPRQLALSSTHGYAAMQLAKRGRIMIATPGHWNRLMQKLKAETRSVDSVPTLARTVTPPVKNVCFTCFLLGCSALSMRGIWSRDNRRPVNCPLTVC